MNAQHKILMRGGREIIMSMHWFCKWTLDHIYVHNRTALIVAMQRIWAVIWRVAGCGCRHQAWPPFGPCNSVLERYWSWLVVFHLPSDVTGACSSAWQAELCGAITTNYDKSHQLTPPHGLITPLVGAITTQSGWFSAWFSKIFWTSSKLFQWAWSFCGCWCLKEVLSGSITT